MSNYFTWECNQVYPSFIHKILNGTIALSSDVGIIKCALVTDAYEPSSEDLTWDVVAASLDADDYYDGFEQGASPGITSTFSLGTQDQVNTGGVYDAYYWGVAWLESNVDSVFESVAALGAGAAGTYLKYVVFYLDDGEGGDQHLLGVIQRDNNGIEINIVPDGGNITFSWYDPEAGSTGEPGILFKFDACDCSKEAIWPVM